MGGLVVAALVAAVSLAQPSGPGVLDVRVTSREVTRPLPKDFLGLALEYGTLRQWVNRRDAPDRILPRLIRNLDPSGRPIVRFGGESTDRNWWRVPGMRRPLGITQTLGPAWIRAARVLVRETDAKLLLGINLEAGSLRLAHIEADRLVRGIGRRNIEALEIGNEPDNYRAIPWYRVHDGLTLPWYKHVGVRKLSRAPGWDPSRYLAQLSRFSRVVPRLPLAGPDTGHGAWLAAFARLVSRHSRVRMLLSHAYPLTNCVRRRASPKYPSVRHLLTLTSSRGMFAGVEPFARLARRDGASYRIDELGPVSCNGRWGVSNTFASALWIMDGLFDAARLGVSGVNLHTYQHTSNSFFDLDYRRSAHRWHAEIHPLYDGALMFARAAPAGSRLLHIAVPRQARLRAWATLDTHRVLRVVLINGAVSGASRVRLHPPAGYASRAASVQWLRAPSAYATGGVRIGGRRFDVTLTGRAPRPRLVRLMPRHGRDLITVPAASAALLTIRPRA